MSSENPKNPSSENGQTSVGDLGSVKLGVDSLNGGTRPAVGEGVKDAVAGGLAKNRVDVSGNGDAIAKADLVGSGLDNAESIGLSHDNDGAFGVRRVSSAWACPTCSSHEPSEPVSVVGATGCASATAAASALPSSMAGVDTVQVPKDLWERVTRCLTLVCGLDRDAAPVDADPEDPRWALVAKLWWCLFGHSRTERAMLEALPAACRVLRDELEKPFAGDGLGAKTGPGLSERNRIWLESFQATAREYPPPAGGAVARLLEIIGELRVAGVAVLPAPNGATVKTMIETVQREAVSRLVSLADRIDLDPDVTEVGMRILAAELEVSCDQIIGELRGAALPVDACSHGKASAA